MANEPKKSFGTKVRGLFGELKKVTYPTFSKVVAQTGVVLAVTLFFLLILMGMDAGLGQLFKLLVRGMDTASITAVSSGFTSNFAGAGYEVSKLFAYIG